MSARSSVAPFSAFLHAGDTGLVVNLEDHPPEKATRMARALAARLEKDARADKIKGIQDMIPGLTNLLIQYDPLVVAPASLGAHVESVLDGLAVDETGGRQVLLPCCYGGEFGPDLNEVAKRTGLTPDEVISRHTTHTLEVVIMGFLPGLAYMKGVDEALYLPRRATPRQYVPALSVGIAMDQTVIYPLSSPGGWNLIGRVPVQLFAPARKQPVLLKSSDKITFQAIDKKEYDKIYKADQADSYAVAIKP